MSRGAIVCLVGILIAAIAVAGVSVYTYATAEYTVIYELNGGTSDNPSHYGRSETLVLHPAEHPLYVFEGWYDENGDIVTQISGRDATLTAGFINNYGKEITYSLSSGDGKHPVSGNATMTYVYSNGENYIVRIEGSFTRSGSSTASAIREGNVLDSAMDGYELTFDRYMVPVSMVRERDGLVFSYESERTVTVDGTVTVTVDSDIGVTGAGEYKIGDTVMLKADIDERIYSIYGWVLDGKRTSRASEITFTAVFDSDYSFSAKAFADEVTDVGKTYTIGTDVPMDVSNWTVRGIDDDSLIAYGDGSAMVCTFDSPGKFQVSVSGKDSDGMAHSFSYILLVDDIETKTFQWTYNGKDYSVDFDIPYHSYRSYFDNYSVKRAQDKKVEANDTVFCTHEDPVIRQFSERFAEITEGMDDWDRANMLLAFTQYIEYRYDKDAYGVEERWNYALETLYDGYGDCEDTSILFCAIAYNLGYDVAEMVFPGHMAGGIVMDIESQHFDRDGMEYRFCETTIEDMPVGEVSSILYTQKNATIYPIS